jgi:hypothetical protein
MKNRRTLPSHPTHSALDLQQQEKINHQLLERNFFPGSNRAVAARELQSWWEKFPLESISVLKKNRVLH